MSKPAAPPDFTPIVSAITKENQKDEKVEEPREFIGESLASFNWKKKIVLFVVFLIVCSTMFINDIIGKISSDFIHTAEATTNKGTIVQGIFLVLIYSLMESLINSKVI